MENEATGYGITRTISPRAVVLTSPNGMSELYERHHAAVCSGVLRAIGNPADAEECGDGVETEQPPQNPARF